MVTNGAIVNDVLADTVKNALQTLYDIHLSDDMHINCMAHIINLVVQDFLGVLDEAELCTADGGANDYFLMHKNKPLLYQPEDDAELQDLEGSREEDMEANDEADDNEGVSDAELNELLKTLTSKTSEAELAEVGQSTLKRVRSHGCLKLFLANAFLNLISSASLQTRLHRPPNDVQGFGESQKRDMVSKGLKRMILTAPSLCSSWLFVMSTHVGTQHTP